MSKSQPRLASLEGLFDTDGIEPGQLGQILIVDEDGERARDNAQVLQDDKVLWDPETIDAQEYRRIKKWQRFEEAGVSGGLSSYRNNSIPKAEQEKFFASIHRDVKYKKPKDNQPAYRNILAKGRGRKVNKSW